MITIFIYTYRYRVLFDTCLFLTSYIHCLNFYGFLFDFIVHLYHIYYMPLPLIGKGFFYACFNLIGCITVYLNSIHSI